MPSRRTVFLPPVLLPSARTLSWPAKDPGATLDFTLDATSFLLDAGNDSIVPNSIHIASNPTDLTFGAPTCSGTAITWLIGDGTPGGAAGGTLTTEYAVRIAFATVGGLSVACTIYLPIQTISSPAYFAPL